MAWTITYGGVEYSAVDDATAAALKKRLAQAAAEGDVAWIHLQTSSAKVELLYTAGTPIAFSWFDEHADTGE